MMKNIPTYCGSKFTWYARTGRCEASDFDGSIGACSPYHNNAYGFYVVSKKTGTKKFFRFVREYDITSDEHVVDFLSEDGIIIQIFND